MTRKRRSWEARHWTDQWGRFCCVIHPLNDSRAHDLENPNCWCKPEVEDDGRSLTHHSADGREALEGTRH